MDSRRSEAETRAATAPATTNTTATAASLTLDRGPPFASLRSQHASAGAMQVAGSRPQQQQQQQQQQQYSQLQPHLQQQHPLLASAVGAQAGALIAPATAASAHVFPAHANPPSQPATGGLHAFASASTLQPYQLQQLQALQQLQLQYVQQQQQQQTGMQTAPLVHPHQQQLHTPPPLHPLHQSQAQHAGQLQQAFSHLQGYPWAMMPAWAMQPFLSVSQMPTGQQQQPQQQPQPQPQPQPQQSRRQQQHDPGTQQPESQEAQRGIPAMYAARPVPSPTVSHVQQVMVGVTMPGKHQCKLCGKCFASSSNLSRHRRIHTGSRPYVCRYCGFAFNNSSNRRKHERAYCRQRPELSEAPEDMTVPSFGRSPRETASPRQSLASSTSQPRQATTTTTTTTTFTAAAATTTTRKEQTKHKRPARHSGRTETKGQRDQTVEKESPDAREEQVPHEEDEASSEPDKNAQA